MAHMFVQIGDTKQQFQQFGPLVRVPIRVFSGQAVDCKIHLREQPVHGAAFYALSTLDIICSYREFVERLFEVMVEAKTFLFERFRDLDGTAFGVAGTAGICHDFSPDFDAFVFPRIP